MLLQPRSRVAEAHGWSEAREIGGGGIWRPHCVSILKGFMKIREDTRRSNQKYLFLQ